MICSNRSLVLSPLLFLGVCLSVSGCDATEPSKNSPTDTAISDTVDATVPTMDTVPGDSTQETFELEGDWSTNYGESYAITGEAWGAYSVLAYDNEANWAVTQYPEDDEWNPNRFAKQVWTEIDGEGFFHHCTVIFAAETYEEALDAENTADDSDLEGAGCGGFPWTHYGPPGSFDDV